MNRLRRTLRSERGSALIDAMLGVVITGLTVTALVGVSVTSSNIVTATVRQADRLEYVNTLVHDLASDPAAVATTVATTPVTLGSVDVQVSRWRVDSTGIATIFAAASKQGATGCNTPAAVTDVTCVVARVDVQTKDPGIQTAAADSVSWVTAGVATATPTPISAGNLGRFTVGTTGEVRYIVNVSSATGPGAIEFRNAGTPVEKILYDETDPATNFVGSVFAAPGTVITIDVTAITGTVTLSRFTVYKGA